MNESLPADPAETRQPKDWPWSWLVGSGLVFGLVRIAMDELSRPMRGVPLPEFAVWYLAGGFAFLLFAALVVLPLAFFVRRTGNKPFRVRRAIVIAGSLMLAFTELVSLGK